MLKEFKVFDKVDTKALAAFNEDLREVLERMASGILFAKEGYTHDEFRALLTDFVAGQRGSLGRTKEGSWSVVPDDSGMPGDARVEFIFVPTYLVTAILTRAFCDYPELVAEVPGFEPSLRKGMQFCSYRGLMGHGIEAVAGAEDALEILSLGEVPVFLESNPEFCSDLHQAIGEAKKVCAEDCSRF